jgi:hypothetical protein
MDANCLRASALCLLCLLACACTTPYSPPKFDPDVAFGGIIESAPDQSNAATKDPRVVWVHGMCHHAPNWQKERIESLEKRSGLTAEPIDAIDVPARLGDPGPLVTVHRYRLRGKGDQAGVQPVINFVSWSALTRDAKRQLCYDSGDRTGNETFDAEVRAVCEGERDWPSPHERGSFNQLLKSVIMNACLSDALIYVGETKARIRERVAIAVCAALSGLPARHSAARTLPPATCYDGNPADWVPSDTPIVFVTESLGSKILIDALAHSTRPGSVHGARAQAGLARALQPTRQVFLLANQLPILGLAEEAALGAAQAPSRDPEQARPPAGLGNMLQLLRPAPGRGAPPDSRAAPGEPQRPKLEVVSFTDPNDLLSYQLRPEDFKADEAIVRVINVHPSNTPTILGLLGRPDHAHMGYRTNPEVVDLLLFGRKPRP